MFTCTLSFWIYCCSASIVVDFKLSSSSSWWSSENDKTEMFEWNYGSKSWKRMDSHNFLQSHPKRVFRRFVTDSNECWTFATDDPAIESTTVDFHLVDDVNFGREMPCGEQSPSESWPYERMLIDSNADLSSMFLHSIAQLVRFIHASHRRLSKRFRCIYSEKEFRLYRKHDFDRAENSNHIRYRTSHCVGVAVSRLVCAVLNRIEVKQRATGNIKWLLFGQWQFSLCLRNEKNRPKKYSIASNLR